MKKRTKPERRQWMIEVEAMLRQSNISAKNLDRLSFLSRSADPGVSTLASFVLDVARVAPKIHGRWLDIASHHPSLFERALTVLGELRLRELAANHGDADGQLWRKLGVLFGQTAYLAPNAPALPATRSADPPPRPSSPQTTHHQPDVPHVEIYTDGGCDPNPGPGGYGVVLVHPKKRAEASGAFRLTTNNRMEILAAIKGLEMLKRPCSVIVYSDSQYLVKAMSQGWAARWKRSGWRLSTKEPAKNVDLWDRLLALCTVHRVSFRWIKGHAGIRENERCDLLCAAAQHCKNLPPDPGYNGLRVGEPG